MNRFIFLYFCLIPDPLLVSNGHFYWIFQQEITLQRQHIIGNFKSFFSALVIHVLMYEAILLPPKADMKCDNNVLTPSSDPIQTVTKL